MPIEPVQVASGGCDGFLKLLIDEVLQLYQTAPMLVNINWRPTLAIIVPLSNGGDTREREWHRLGYVVPYVCSRLLSSVVVVVCR